MEKLPSLDDDGLITPDVGDWAEEKYRLVSTYAGLFASAMKGKWDARVYIDLFAGAGRSRIENTKRILPASPLLALSISFPFDKYIFCEKEDGNRNALVDRVKRDYSAADVSFIEDANMKVDSVIGLIPKHNNNFRVLSFCFADPYNMKNLKYQTIKALAEKYIDFLILLPVWMDANRNLKYYIEPANTVIEDFTGVKNWRADWEKVGASGQEFGAFVADLFGKQMESLNYKYSGLSDMILVRSTDKNLPLYYLAFFSRHPRGTAFWQEAKKYRTDQLGLFER